jgi:hypothetical protein
MIRWQNKTALMKIYGPNHVKTRHFLEYEDKKIRASNQSAKKFGVGPYRDSMY